jgi:hypothetical protein
VQANRTSRSVHTATPPQQSTDILSFFVFRRISSHSSTVGFESPLPHRRTAPHARSPPPPRSLARTLTLPHLILSARLDPHHSLSIVTSTCIFDRRPTHLSRRARAQSVAIALLSKAGLWSDVHSLSPSFFSELLRSHHLSLDPNRPQPPTRSNT